MSASLRKKSPKTKISKPKKKQEKQENSAQKPDQTPRKTTFVEESGKKKEEEEVAVNFQCAIGFAIRVDKGSNTKGGFDKKLTKDLTFFQRVCRPGSMHFTKQKG